MTTPAEAAHIQNFLNALRNKLGEGEHPDGSNHNSITKWYNENVDKIGDGPWCEMTQTFGMWTSGAKALKVGRAYTVWAAQDAVKKTNKSSWHWGTAGMRAGDSVYFDWQRSGTKTIYVDHVGAVERVVGNGKFYTLEGNYHNHLRRVLRDGTYVVGYVRYDWASLPPLIATSPVKSTPKNVDARMVRMLQRIFEVTPSGAWNAATEARWQLMRTAARAHVRYPRNIRRPFHVKEVQRVIDTTPDGIWGRKSQRAMIAWTMKVQKPLGVKRDGEWGPVTDHAYIVVRKNNRR